MDVAVYPVEAVLAPTDEQLQAVPGAWAAHRGLASLKLLACALSGSKVKIQPERLAEFDGAPLDVQDELDSVKTAHAAEYEDLLSHLLAQPNDPQGSDQQALAGATAVDCRGARAAASEDTKAADLATFESEESLRSAVKIVAEAKSAHKAVHLLKDDKDVYYLVARSDDVALPVGTYLGGVGGGAVLAADAGQKRCFVWRFPEGDKTWVQLSRTVDEEATKDGPKPAKFSSGALYAIVRELEASAAAPPKMTSFGQLTPAGTAGRHHYVFEIPEDHESHKSVAYVPSPPQTNPKAALQANNFLGNLSRDAGVGNGALLVCWRMNYDSVNNFLKPAKPYVVAGKRIVLNKGKPVRAAWPAAGS